jgi:hypothetical protein
MQWSVFNLVRILPSNVVEMVCCNVSLTEGQYTASDKIYQRVPYKSPSDPGFIPFDQLTEAETIEWVKQQLGQFGIDQIERGLQQNILAQQVKTANGVPW